MKIISIAPVASQKFNIVLAGQNCQIAIYQKLKDTYIDVAVSNVPVVTAMLCLDRVMLVRQGYRGFVGNIAFADTQGVTDPVYTGFDTRYRLIYLEDGEV